MNQSTTLTNHSSYKRDTLKNAPLASLDDFSEAYPSSQFSQSSIDDDASDLIDDSLMEITEKELGVVRRDSLASCHNKRSKYKYYQQQQHGNHSIHNGNKRNRHHYPSNNYISKLPYVELLPVNQAQVPNRKQLISTSQQSPIFTNTDPHKQNKSSRSFTSPVSSPSISTATSASDQRFIPLTRDSSQDSTGGFERNANHSGIPNYKTKCIREKEANRMINSRSSNIITVPATPQSYIRQQPVKSKSTSDLKQCQNNATKICQSNKNTSNNNIVQDRKPSWTERLFGNIVVGQQQIDNNNKLPNDESVDKTLTTHVKMADNEKKGGPRKASFQLNNFLKSSFKTTQKSDNEPALYQASDHHNQLEASPNKIACPTQELLLLCLNDNASPDQTEQQLCRQSTRGADLRQSVSCPREQPTASSMKCSSVPQNIDDERHNKPNAISKTVKFGSPISTTRRSQLKRRHFKKSSPGNLVIKPVIKTTTYTQTSTEFEPPPGFTDDVPVNKREGDIVVCVAPKDVVINKSKDKLDDESNKSDSSNQLNNMSKASGEADEKYSNLTSNETLLVENVANNESLKPQVGQLGDSKGLILKLTKSPRATRQIKSQSNHGEQLSKDSVDIETSTRRNLNFYQFRASRPIESLDRSNTGRKMHFESFKSEKMSFPEEDNVLCLNQSHASDSDNNTPTTNYYNSDKLSQFQPTVSKSQHNHDTSNRNDPTENSIIDNLVDNNDRSRRIHLSQAKFTSWEATI